MFYFCAYQEVTQKNIVCYTYVPIRVRLTYLFLNRGAIKPKNENNFTRYFHITLTCVNITRHYTTLRKETPHITSAGFIP